MCVILKKKLIYYDWPLNLFILIGYGFFCYGVGKLDRRRVVMDFELVPPKGFYSLKFELEMQSKSSDENWPKIIGSIALLFFGCGGKPFISGERYFGGRLQNYFLQQATDFMFCWWTEVHLCRMAVIVKWKFFVTLSRVDTWNYSKSL